MKSLFEQTGWRRPGPFAICQDLDILARVTDLSYDLTNEAFVDYFQARTGTIIRRCECGWVQVVENFANPALPSPALSWTYTKAKLQDCWELFLISIPQHSLTTKEPPSILAPVHQETGDLFAFAGL